MYNVYVYVQISLGYFFGNCLKNQMLILANIQYIYLLIYKYYPGGGRKSLVIQTFKLEVRYSWTFLYNHTYYSLNVKVSLKRQATLYI
jgi:hypothetical protein